MDNRKELAEQYDRIYRYCYYRLRHRELAEDITQETFLRFFRREQYHFLENPLKIMYVIARNLCVDQCRRSNRAGVERMEVEELAGAGIEEGIVDREILRGAMSRLGEEEREIVFLRAVNGEDFSVIGEMTGLSRYAVRRRYQSALQTLRKELTD